MNPNSNSGLTSREKWALERKAKQGWKCYYIEREYVYQLQQTRNHTRETAQQIRNGETVDYANLAKMFLELYDKSGEMCDCPVCLMPMEANNTHIPLCGHLICKECKAVPQVDRCPICRKSW